jgi:uncharacterized membrane protein
MGISSGQILSLVVVFFRFLRKKKKKYRTFVPNLMNFTSTSLKYVAENQIFICLEYIGLSASPKLNMPNFSSEFHEFYFNYTEIYR